MTQATFVTLGSGEPCPDDRGSSREMIDYYQTLCGKCLHQTDCDEPGPYIIEAYIIHIEAGFIRSKHDQSRCYVLIGAAIRIAFRLGLHRDSTKILGRISVFSEFYPSTNAKVKGAFPHLYLLSHGTVGADNVVLQKPKCGGGYGTSLCNWTTWPAFTWACPQWC
jgi:hypothetical protein